MRLIDRDALLKSAHYIETGDLNGYSILYPHDVLDAPTIDAVPVNELLKLRDWLYESDGITMGGLRSLNELIAKYSSCQLPRIENGFERRNDERG